MCKLNILIFVKIYCFAWCRRKFSFQCENIVFTREDFDNQEMLALFWAPILIAILLELFELTMKNTILVVLIVFLIFSIIMTGYIIIKKTKG